MAADPHAFVVAQQMRRGVAADAVTGMCQHRFQHCTARTLAVGAADRDERKSRIDPQRAAHLLDAVEAEGNRLRMQLLEIDEPLL